MQRTVRDLTQDDIPLMIRYFHSLSPYQLRAMGVEPKKLPPQDEWADLLRGDLDKDDDERQFYYLIWEIDGKASGHSNINKIDFGRHAFMHLHLWEPCVRRSGNGTFFIRESLPRYFDRFRLKSLFCEPYAFNDAPNRILEKTGFRFIRQYETVPGWINFRQKVNRWQMDCGKSVSD